jgi:hypothetical protein
MDGQGQVAYRKTCSFDPSQEALTLEETITYYVF